MFGVAKPEWEKSPALVVSCHNDTGHHIGLEAIILKLQKCVFVCVTMLVVKDSKVVQILNWSYKIFSCHCSCTARSSFFSERVTDIWNSLPSDVVDFFYL